MDRKEYLRNWMRAYRAKHPEAVQRVEQNRDKVARAKARREARASGREPYKEALSKSYQKHKTKRAAEMKIWREANKKAVLLYMRCFKAKRRAMEFGNFTTEDIEFLFEKQDGECVACQGDISDKFEIDHVEPIAKGGSNWPSNLQLLCRKCNRSKGHKTMQQWNDYLTQHSGGDRICLYF